MGAGAYVVPIDRPSLSGPAGTQERVVPVPAPGLSGLVKFTNVVISLAYDDFGDSSAPSSIDANIRVLRGGGQVQVISATLDVGRTWYVSLQPGDQAVSVQIPVGNDWPGGFTPQVSALVEYGTQ